jgi:hypothetical protein
MCNMIMGCSSQSGTKMPMGLMRGALTPPTSIVPCWCPRTAPSSWQAQYTAAARPCSPQGATANTSEIKDSDTYLELSVGGMFPISRSTLCCTANLYFCLRPCIQKVLDHAPDDAEGGRCIDDEGLVHQLCRRKIQEHQSLQCWCRGVITYEGLKMKKKITIQTWVVVLVDTHNHSHDPPEVCRHCAHPHACKYHDGFGMTTAAERAVGMQLPRLLETHTTPEHIPTPSISISTRDCSDVWVDLYAIRAAGANCLRYFSCKAEWNGM